MNAPTEVIEADRALKTKRREMWASGDYPAVAADLIPDLGAILVDACGVRPSVPAGSADPDADGPL